ncbi:response regulator [Sulfurimonas marina]|uniref:Response regulator n=1 Tax=Sulfurimonas marina TaxID=2590551 RepID=A0A7M1AUR2_9BACT|nr:HD domain-containing phosphohydrolase [Sulfurimonas marina]QOP41165.1 response regulator [Sulfurimonas marina]
MRYTQKKLLVVDDESTNLHFLDAILGSDYDVHLASNASDAIESAQSFQPDLILLDIQMPDKNGFEVAEYLHKELQLEIPIMFVTGSKEAESVKKALELGACDYIVKPFEPNIIQKKVKNTLQKTSQYGLKKVYTSGVKLMDAFFAQGVSGIKKEKLYEWAEDLVSTIEQSNISIGKLINLFQDTYTVASHNVNVCVLSVLLGRQLRMQHSQLIEIALAAVLHDIGKLNIAKEILDKPSGLQQNEIDEMQSHPIKSVELAKELGIKKREIIQGIEFHHEKLDGTGYPNYLIGSQIPTYAQILCVCDIFDALTTKRTFRENYSSFDALMLMKKTMSTQINENFVNKLITLLR